MSSVSVVIPCYRYGHFLEEAVASVLSNQDGVEVRVLIIDDASPDDSAVVAARIAASDPRVELIVHSENKGNIATFNEGLLEWADGDYCMLMSADDRATPGALRRASDLLDAHPEVGLVYGRALWFTDGDPVPPARTHVRGWSVYSGQDWLKYRFRQAENPITAPEVVVRTSLHKQVGGYDPQLPQAADMEIFMRMAAYSDVGYIRGVDQAFYRLHRENMRKAVSTLSDLSQRRMVFELVLERYAERLRDTDGLREMVHRQLGREALWAAARVSDGVPHAAQNRVGRRLLGTGMNEQGDVEELVEFAVECSPDLKKSALYRALQSDDRFGPRELLFMLSQKGQWWLRRRSWKYRGV